MAIAWIVEQDAEGGEYGHGPYHSAFEALTARDKIEEQTVMYIATDSRTAAIELPVWGHPRPVAGWALPGVWESLERLEARNRSDDEWPSKI